MWVGLRSGYVGVVGCLWEDACRHRSELTKDHAFCPAIEGGGQCAEPFLPSSVPNCEPDVLFVDPEPLDGEIHSCTSAVAISQQSAGELSEVNSPMVALTFCSKVFLQCSCQSVRHTFRR